MPGPAPSVYSPFIRWGAPRANSTTSTPRWMSPLASAIVLPCSRARMSASWSLSRAMRSRNFISTRARRCGIGRAPGRLRGGGVLDRGADFGGGGERDASRAPCRPSAGKPRRCVPTCRRRACRRRNAHTRSCLAPFADAWLRLLCRRLLRTAIAEIAQRLCGIVLRSIWQRRAVWPSRTLVIVATLRDGRR